MLGVDIQMHTLTCTFESRRLSLYDVLIIPDQATQLTNQKTSDATADLIIWTAIEANTIISAAALQCIGPFVQMMRDKGASLASRISSRFYSKRQSQYSDQLFGSAPQSPTSPRPFPNPYEQLTMQHFADKDGSVAFAGRTRRDRGCASHV